MKRRETDSLEDVGATLEGRVSHVAKLAFLPGILSGGLIYSNQEGTLESTFGYPNAYFRARGYVSVFDYRSRPPDDEPVDFRARCYPFGPASPDQGGGAAIFVLHPKSYEHLVPWTVFREEEASRSEMIVPYVESGYPKAIPLTHVEEIMIIELIEDPSSLAAAYRRAAQARRHRT